MFYSLTKVEVVRQYQAHKKEDKILRRQNIKEKKTLAAVRKKQKEEEKA